MAVHNTHNIPLANEVSFGENRQCIQGIAELLPKNQYSLPCRNDDLPLVRVPMMWRIC